MNNPSILIVDDSQSARFALEKIFTSKGAEVTIARDGNHALPLVRKKKFDLVMTDIEMPTMDGYTLCSAIKNDVRTKSVPVLIFSKNTDDESIEQGFKAGASGFISKKDITEKGFDKAMAVINQNMFHKKRTILVVDDCKAILDMVRNDLEREGFRVVCVQNGFKAISTLDTGRPVDLIITDLEMPGMDGRKLCKLLQSNDNYSKIPIVLMSGDFNRLSMVKLIREGAAAYIPKPFHMDQLRLLIERLLSDHYRILLEEKRRVEAERALLFASISSLIAALEARDKYTQGHSENVARLSLGIGRHLDGKDVDFVELELAGKLHDLGKIGIRDKVLLKPGTLSPDEYSHIQEHTKKVVGILFPIPSLSNVLEAAKYHHERWNGSGYPDGLVGNEIPLLARIVAIADTFDAITGERPYRKGRSDQDAIRIIKNGRNVLFCPECVDAFMKFLEEDYQHCTA